MEWPTFLEAVQRMRSQPKLRYAKDAPRCVHCKHRACHHPRGLCRCCYMTPTIRALYPTMHEHCTPKGEPTEAELEAMIAEQAATMPPKGRNTRPPTKKLRSLQRQ